jgi:hypothetical protein
MAFLSRTGCGGRLVWLPATALWLLFFLPDTLFAQRVPEKLVYSLSWLGIPVGIATQEIVAEGAARRITSTARSNDWLSTFFPVEDVIVSSLAMHGAPFPGLTRHYRMVISEGSHRRDREIVFEQEKGTARYHDLVNGEKIDIPIAATTYDIYGSFYYVRYLPLEVGKPVSVNVLDGKELHAIEVRVLRKERLKTVLGEVDTIVIRPMVKAEGVFEGKGSVTIWLTDDARRIPVRAQTKVKVGSVIATLTGGDL